MAMATKKQIQRIPRYKDSEGWYIDVFELREGIVIAWTDGINEGACVGEETGNSNEHRTLRDTMREFADANEDHVYKPEGGAWRFESLDVAKKAKRLLNAALVNMQNARPLPDWAQKAIAEGWSPPKGWRP